MSGNPTSSGAEGRRGMHVFTIDDGETHRYVATDEAAARELHRSGFWLGEPENPEGEWSVSETASDKELRIHFDDPSDVKVMPAGASVVNEPRYIVIASAAAWAATYTEPGFLCSTVF